MSQVTFSSDTKQRKLLFTGLSFWRTIYQQKYPDAPVLDTEDVLVFKVLSL